MTPLVNESNSGPDLNLIFSQALFQQMRENPEILNLKKDGPLFEILHPKILKTILFYKEDPHLPLPQVSLPEWHLHSCSSVEEAKSLRPDCRAVTGRPFEVSRFLNEAPDCIIFDFESLGSAIISKSPLELVAKPGLHQHLIPIWVTYALSPELWGPQGKWVRFHERLYTILEDKKLLSAPDYPGQYLLDRRAKKLENFGIEGSDDGSNYMLTLSWTFPLSALNKLEKIIHSEF